jgi:hypothetical protein
MDPLGDNMPEVIDCEDFFPLLALQLGLNPLTLTEPLLYGCQKLEVQGKCNASNWNMTLS